MFITITNNNTIQNTPSRGFSVKLREKETETREKDAEPIYILRKPEKISLRVTNRSSIRFSKKKKKNRCDPIPIKIQTLPQTFRECIGSPLDLHAQRFSFLRVDFNQFSSAVILDKWQ